MSNNIDFEIKALRAYAGLIKNMSFDIDAFTKSIESGQSMGEMQTQTDQLVSLLKETAESLKKLVTATYTILTNTANRLESTDEKMGGN